MSDKFEKAIASIKKNCDVIDAFDQLDQLQVLVSPETVSYTHLTLPTKG